ncbi:hypothetical protein SAMN04487926_10815 [Paraburkholderia steynii]|uniref:Uncharacterized protein n=1 Tax=Paraburkholderia steynii TaxID=1245441 RepID=A0A7Z7B716_9BURK|nr:hypothetical protein [Paraburkholderia steynii]SDH78278.1 hypothetical protein SAMN04487926_10815 [Paraburkholderia steynii]
MSGDPRTEHLSYRHKLAFEIFEGLLWPAAAGNVLWSLIALTTLEPKPLTYPMVTRASVLLLLGAYLCLEWIRNYRSLPKPITWRFWVFDLLHLLAVAWTAIVTSDGSDLLVVALVAYFIITGTGHLSGAYKYAQGTRTETVGLALINYLGVAIIYAGYLTGHDYRASMQWTLPLSLLIVIVLWLGWRWRQLCELLGFAV